MSLHRLAARLIGAAILAIGLTACDSAVTPTPPPPPPPPPPAPSPPQPGPAGVTVSGVVLEFTATGQQRPVPNVRLKVWTEGSGSGEVARVPRDDAITDAQGRYTITDVTSFNLYFHGLSGSDQSYTVTASKTGYNRAAREVLAGWDREVHFELTRR